jgi:hypothetical protein
VIIKDSHHRDDDKNSSHSVQPRVDGFHQELAAFPGPWQAVDDDGYGDRKCLLKINTK